MSPPSTLPHSDAAQPFSVLVVEDMDSLRAALVSELRRAGVSQVLEASEGDTALRLFTEQRPDLVLLDIQLPGMDGYAVAQALRACKTLPNLPIVAVTSYAMPGDRERCLASGCDGYIEKPIDPATFADEVAGYLENRP